MLSRPLNKAAWAQYKQWNVIDAATWMKARRHPKLWDPPCDDDNDAFELCRKACATQRLSITQHACYKKYLIDLMAKGEWPSWTKDAIKDPEFDPNEIEAQLDDEEVAMINMSDVQPSVTPPHTAMITTAGEDLSQSPKPLVNMPISSGRYEDIDPNSRFYWYIITLFPHKIDLEVFKDWVQANRTICKCIISDVDLGEFKDLDTNECKPHHHILVKYRAGFHTTHKRFKKQLGSHAQYLYTKPLQKVAGKSLEESKNAYVKYIMNKGLNVQTIKGDGMKLGDDIVADIKQGFKWEEIIIKYSANLQLARELWKQVAEKDRPQCGMIYIWGPTDMGKTTTVISMLRMCKQQLEGPNWWIKADFGKWWSGYNTQEIIVIDDIDVFNESTVTTLKLLISQGCFSPEIKYGHVDIMAKCLIIITNKSPDEYIAAMNTTPDQVPPMIRRLTKGVGCFNVNTKDDCRIKMPPRLYKCLANIFGYEQKWAEVKEPYERCVEDGIIPMDATITMTSP